MRITGNSDVVTQLRFHHHGAELNFECILNPKPYEPVADLSQGNRAIIEFSDLYEVDSLIEMLKKFKQEATLGYMGEWKSTR